MNKLLLILACALFTVSPLAAQTNRRTQSKPKVDLAKKIADATPEALPQGPRTGKTVTDAQDLNLKGKVKVVTDYSFAPNGKREFDTESFFDENGFLVKVINYDEGYPESVTVWGWIDGARVSRSNDIEYADGEKPAPRNMTITETYVPSAAYANMPTDDRYSVKYVYKYDDAGRLIEKSQLRNNGEVWGRTVYTYNADRRDERYFGTGGQEYSHTAYIVDKNGNASEQLGYGEGDKLVDDNTYQRTLDAQGNWTVEKTFEKKTVRGKPVLKPLWTNYRTITYYP